MSSTVMHAQEWTEWLRLGKDVEICGRMNNSDTLRILLRKHTLYSGFINEEPVLVIEFKNKDLFSLKGELLARRIMEEEPLFNHFDTYYSVFSSKDNIYYSYAEFLLGGDFLKLLSTQNLSKAYISSDKGFERIWRLNKRIGKSLSAGLSNASQ